MFVIMNLCGVGVYLKIVIMNLCGVGLFGTSFDDLGLFGTLFWNGFMPQSLSQESEMDDLGLLKT